LGQCKSRNKKRAGECLTVPERTINKRGKRGVKKWGSLSKSAGNVTKGHTCIPLRTVLSRTFIWNRLRGKAHENRKKRNKEGGKEEEGMGLRKRQKLHGCKKKPEDLYLRGCNRRGEYTLTTQRKKAFRLNKMSLDCKHGVRDTR